MLHAKIGQMDRQRIRREAVDDKTLDDVHYSYAAGLAA
jgi:formate-dependent phosphoribosylglycinamide formyltransferase (GAR transformylase)